MRSAETRPPPGRGRIAGDVVATVALAAALYVGARPSGPLPAVGPLLEPARGAWAMARAVEHPADARAVVPGLGDAVEVRYDDRGVPHIFALTLDDAWRALGYVVARDRLAQLELQTLAGEGRLTEIAGVRALPLDREMREAGLPARARERWATMPETALVRRALVAFAAGVNAHVDALGASAVPIEHHLLGRRPARWQPEHSLALMGRMAWTLSYNEGELQREQARALVGDAAADALFPRDMPLQEPIVPNGLGRPREAFMPLPPPAVRAMRGSVARAGRLRDDGRADARDALGSNSWAVAPSRSATGHALLAGDPHLELTLPSIWYEVHLVVRDSLDVYGVTIPGAPAVIIGFNRDAAWTYTNVEGDLVDRYVETVDDAARPVRYRLDGAWKPLRTRVDLYRDANGDIISTDTVRLTHRGPLTRTGDGRWISTRWTALEASQDVEPFIHAMFARDVADYRARTARYESPPQNMLVADRRGGIAIRSTGRFPLRPAGGGPALQDGTRSAVDWTGALALARQPESVDPAQGFLASANQQPRDPATDPTYLGADWYPPWRAMRINALLRADSVVTPDAMRRFQTDPGSARADAWVPVLLAAAARETAAGRGGEALRVAARRLGEWDRRYVRESRRASLFEAAMRQVEWRTWDELLPGEPGVRPRFPNDAILLGLARDSGSAWWDDRRTPARETRDAVLAAAIVAAHDSLVRERGSPDGDGWRWDRVRVANVHHLLRIPAFGALDVPVQGGPSTLSPSSGRGVAGASWRMVVELDRVPRAWTTYPGGQSGNPASRFYRDRMGAWARGELSPALVPRRARDLPASRTVARLTLRPPSR